MHTTSAPISKRDTRPGNAALIAGIGLLVMGVVAPIAHLGIITLLTVPGDLQATAANLAESSDLIRVAAAAFVVVAILDMVVAWGLYLVLCSVNPGVALLVAWLRLAYAAVLAAAVNGLVSVVRVGSSPCSRISCTGSSGCS